MDSRLRFSLFVYVTPRAGRTLPSGSGGKVEVKLHERSLRRGSGKQGSGDFVLRSACTGHAVCYMSRRESYAPHAGRGFGQRQRNTRLGPLLWCDKRSARWNFISDAYPGEQLQSTRGPTSPELWPCDALWWRANASCSTSSHLPPSFRIGWQEETPRVHGSLGRESRDSKQRYQDWSADM